jgi:S-DNA-T family DNA segregation ATPase FtsK/SpoIIIE
MNAKTAKSMGTGAGWIIRRNPRLTAFWVVAVTVASLMQHWLLSLALFAAVMVPGLAGSFAGRRWPQQWRRVIRAPRERRRWKRRARRQWDNISDACGLSQKVTGKRLRRRNGHWKRVPTTWVRRPRLRRPKAHGNTLVLTIKHRRGQVNEDILKNVEHIVSALGAVEWATSQPNLQTVIVEAIMKDSLKGVRNAKTPTKLTDGITAVDLGRRQDGERFRLRVWNQHTMIFGVTGSGKNSIMNGALVELAPGVPSGLIRLWGCDLKGTEFGPFREIFHSYTKTTAGAVELLHRLMAIKDARSVEMERTRCRFFEPRPGHPLHVLVVDEFAAPGYDGTFAGKKLAQEFYGLMAIFLTQGRSYGISVLCAQQDPRKEVAGLRDRFTQFVVLRMSTQDETTMVLGRGHGVRADLIPGDKPGTGYVIEEDRHSVKFRADWYSDAVMRATGKRYPAPIDVTALPEAPAEPAKPSGAGYINPRRRSHASLTAVTSEPPKPRRGTVEHNAELAEETS